MSGPEMAPTRQQWFQRLFPTGVPRLWCPPLTHYDAEGQIDERRIQAHLRFLSPWVKALLVPGSTGDGWELTAAEAARVVEIAWSAASGLGQHLLLGALHPDGGQSRQMIQTLAKHRQLTPRDQSPPLDWINRTPACGFAVCPPRGEQLTQAEIRSDLIKTLELGLPTALYQLPQVTQNEMSAGLVAELAAAYPNFILFKDTSGGDKVAKSGMDLQGVFLVRGMEGDYAKWLHPGGGPYDGFLLSAANYFARELSEIIDLVRAGRDSQAESLSARVSQVVREVFAAAKPLPDGNVFANAGKAIDHFFAHGLAAEKAPPPRLHSGRTLPLELLQLTAQSLRANHLMPARGYLAVD
jgi:dihydrodipicolinate synthase/N-acetylneuraminate lyase